ncbi:acyltransferase [Desulfovibrio sp. ZJ369]|uniref:acyltransferase n=1 Tax=Desulfovibrio sp. ZJ369 TaxID=2709793 RepID=UPI0013EBB8D7|nr:acyltransferase [Desulfovibrio sp. ZJ369]
MEYFVHPTACVEAGARIGAGTRIWHFCHVMSEAVIGRNCNIGQNVFVDNGAVVGDNCKLQNNVSVYRHVTLEDGVFCGPSMVFTNVFNPRAEIKKMDQARPTLIRQGASLGANCVIVCGLIVGRCAFVGAGAVVTRHVPDHALVFGNPARQRGWVCTCGEKLDAALRCQVCGQQYAPGAEGLGGVHSTVGPNIAKDR